MEIEPVVQLLWTVSLLNCALSRKICMGTCIIDFASIAIESCDVCVYNVYTETGCIRQPIDTNLGVYTCAHINITKPKFIRKINILWKIAKCSRCQSPRIHPYAGHCYCYIKHQDFDQLQLLPRLACDFNRLRWKTPDSIFCKQKS